MKDSFRKKFANRLPIVVGILLLGALFFSLPLSNFLLFGALPFVIFLGLGPNFFENLNDKFLRIPNFLFGSVVVVLTFTICTAIALDPLAAIPKIQDEINYYFQAKILSSGKIFVESHPLADFFQYRFFVNDGRMYSLFQPGWPVLLAIGHRLGAPFLVAPLLASLSVGFFFGIGRRLFGESVGRWSVLSLMSCSVFLFQSASMMAHGPALAFFLITFYACIRGFSESKVKWFLLAGFAAGGLFSIRAATAFALLLPLAFVGTLFLFQKKIELKNLVLLGLAFLPGALLQAYYNFTLTDSIFSFPQDHYFNLTEATQNCHRLGIGEGIGCAYEHGPDLGKNGFTLRRAFEVSAIRLNFFRFDLFGLGFGAILVFLPWLTKTSRAKYIILAFPLSLISVYFFYYYHAESRYYFEGIVFAFLLIVLGFDGLLRRLNDVEAIGNRLGFALVLASFSALVLTNLTVNSPTKWKQYQSYWQHHKKVAATINKSRPANSVIFVPKVSRMYWTGFWMNEASLDGDFIVAIDQGRQVNTQLANYYPERDFYKLSHSGKLRKIVLKPNPQKITIEAETKFPVPIKEKGHALEQSMRPWKIPTTQLLFDTSEAGAFMTFKQYIFEDGMYEIKGVFGQGPDYGVFELEVDGKKLEPEFDGFSSKIEMKKWSSQTRVALQKGLVKITLRVSKKNPASKSFVAGIDKLILTKVD